MRYIDERGENVESSYSDGRHGEWVACSVPTEFHEGTPGKAPVTEPVPNGIVFLEDGTVYKADPSDSEQCEAVAALKVGDPFNGSTVKALADGERVLEAGIEPVEPWCEYEDGMVWKPYTADEISALESRKRAEEAAEADRKAKEQDYANLKAAVSDLNELMAELVAGDASESTEG